MLAKNGISGNKRTEYGKTRETKYRDASDQVRQTN